MRLPFDPILTYYLIGSGFFLAGGVVGYALTRSQFFTLAIVLSVLAALFFCFFFRDPDRTIPTEPNVIVAAADGKILAVNTVQENDYIKGEAQQIITFLSPADVHVNRSPIAGTVEWVQHSKGGHKPAFSEGAPKNERNSVGLVTASGQKYLVRQIVGTLARRILCRVKVGDTLQLGERFGIIQFGSRTDVFVPLNCEIKVKVGDKIVGGETVLAVCSGQ